MDADLPPTATAGVRSATFGQLDAGTLYALLRLRTDVFVVEQSCPYPELDGRDTEPGTTHLWTEDEAGVSSYLRLLADPAARRIGRVCTRADVRGQGLAVALVARALELADGHDVVLDAQSHLAGWYTRFGFAVGGAPFIEDGIPHTPMRLARRTVAP